MIDGGPKTLGFRRQGGRGYSSRVSEGPTGGLSGVPSSQPREALSVSNCDIEGFLLINSGTDLRFLA